MILEHKMLFAPAAAFGLSLATLLVLLRFPELLVDQPNQRSLHVVPVPRTGGIAIVTGLLIAVAAMVPGFAVFILCALLIAIISLIDDWRHLRPLTRFGAQGLIAATFCNFALGQPSFSESIFLVLAIVWLSNLYNFMDGSDGLAGGMSLIGFGACAIGAWMAGNAPLSMLCGSIAAASIPFLASNFHPARIFMGDIGAVTLGFSAAAVGAMGWRDGVWSPFFPVFAFSPFIADASLTLLHRILKKEKFWQPHREHYYQKLVRMGLGHRMTALVEYGVMTVSAGGAIATLFMDGSAQLAAIVAWGTLLILAAALIDRRWAIYEGERQ